MSNLGYILVCSIVFCLGCSKDTSHPYLVIPERITSQLGIPVTLYPISEEVPNPRYDWQCPKHHIITKYSLHCRGHQEKLETDDCILYDCDGLQHSLFQEFFVFPRLVTIIRLLNTHFPCSIVEGYCCPNHLAFSSAQGNHLSKKHLIGAAALLSLPDSISLDHIKRILPALYTQKQVLPFIKEFQKSEVMLENGEFSLKIQKMDGYSYLTIEILYDLENNIPVI